MIEWRKDELEDGLVLIMAEGFLANGETIGTFKSLKEELSAGNQKKVIISFEKVGYVNYDGLAFLVTWCRELKAIGGGLVIMKPIERFEGFIGKVPPAKKTLYVCSSLEDAMATFKDEPIEAVLA